MAAADAPAKARESAAMAIIAHRGASADRPEHTLAAYERAIDAGADYIEADLVATRDLVLIARHENELSDTTDVASREEFADRRREKTIDGQRVAGWFAEDFTLAEIRTLRAKERMPSIRAASARFDGLYHVPTLEEIVKLLRAKGAGRGREIGLYLELKHPGFLLQQSGIDMVDLLLRDTRALGLSPQDKLIVESFEVGALQRLAARSDLRLAQLVRPDGGPADEPALRYREMVTPSGLQQIARYADILAADIRMILGPDGTPTALLRDARAAGLDVHAWTLRPENAFLPPALRSGDAPSARGCGDVRLARMLEAAGVRGVFTDAGLIGRACAEALAPD